MAFDKKYEIRDDAHLPTPEQRKWIRARWKRSNTFRNDLVWECYNRVADNYRERVTIAHITPYGNEWFYHLSDVAWKGSGKTIEQAVFDAEYGIHCYLSNNLKLNDEYDGNHVDRFLENIGRSASP